MLETRVSEENAVIWATLGARRGEIGSGCVCMYVCMYGLLIFSNFYWPDDRGIGVLSADEKTFCSAKRPEQL
jgi:hypothetical protein